MNTVLGSGRKRLAKLVLRLRDEAIPAATCYLECLIDRGDPFFRRLLQAPLEEEELSGDGHRLLDEADRDIEAGRLLGLQDVKRELGL